MGDSPEHEGVIDLTVSVFRPGGRTEETAEACSRVCARFLLNDLLDRLAEATGQQEE